MNVRLTLAALVVIPAAMAFPWQSTSQRWLLGVAVAIVVVLFAWWRGMFVTTIVARRLAMLTRRRSPRGTSSSAEYATVTLRVTPRETSELPVALVAGYLDRYGISFDKVRITGRDRGAVRTTWVALTLGAADNVAALTARSPQLPLHATAQLAARRLADHLREIGWEVSLDDAPDVPVEDGGRETWRGVTDGRSHLAAYRIAVDEQLAETLSSVWSSGADETWTALEFTGSRTCPEVAAMCALRTGERPGSRAPVAGLTPQHGVQGCSLTALAPGSDLRLSAHPVPVPSGLPAGLSWPAGAALSRT